MPFDGFLTGDGNHAPDYVKNGNFELNKESLRSRALKAWWPLVGAKRGRDLSGFGNHATVAGTGNKVAYSPSKFSHIVSEFDTGKRLESDFKLDTSLPFSISFQYRIDSYTDEFPGACAFEISGGSEPYQLFFNRTNAGFKPFSFGSKETGFITSHLSDAVHTYWDEQVGETHRLLHTYNGLGVGTLGNFKVYRDGINQTTENASGYGAATNKTRIGQNGIAIGKFDGQVFDLTVNQTEFSAIEAAIQSSPENVWDSYYETGRVSYFFVPAAAGGDPTMVAVQGSYSLTGQAANTVKDTPLTAAQGSYALTGKDSNTLWGRKMSAAQGSFALNGQAVNTLWGHKISAAQGSYALNGQAAVLSRQIAIAAIQGSYALTGQAANLLYNRLVAAVQGSYALNGQDATLKTGEILAAIQGSYALSGQAVNLLWAHEVLAAQGSYALSGQAAITAKTVLLAAAQGGYTLTGQASILRWDRVLAAVQGSYSLNGQAAITVKSIPMVAPQGSYALNGQAALFLLSQRLAAAQGSYALSGQDAVLFVTLVVVTSTPASLVLGDAGVAGAALTDVAVVAVVLGDGGLATLILNDEGG